LGRSNRPQAVISQRGGLTAQGMRSNRPGHVSRFLLFVALPCCIAALVQGECALAHGELAYVHGGALCVVRALDWWLVLFA
jgi:hypothetical protein